MSHMLIVAVESSASFLTWLSPLLMVCGVVILGVIAALMIRGGKPKSGPGAAETEAARVLQQVEDARYQIEDVRSRVGELIATAQRLSTRLDEKTAKVEALLAKADRRVQSESAAHETSRAALPRSAGSSTAVESKPISRPKIHANEDGKTDPLKKAVYELADSGRAPVDIAHELKEHVGKVELILALREM